MTTVIRVREETHEEVTRIAAFRGEQPAQLIADAWREYIETVRDEFAADLEKAAQLMRDGTLEELATAFVNQSVPARAKRAARQASQTARRRPSRPWPRQRRPSAALGWSAAWTVLRHSLVIPSGAPSSSAKRGSSV